MVNNFEVLPDSVKTSFPFFIINNWIESYQTLHGIRDVLKTMSKKTSLPPETRYAMKMLKRNYYSLHDDFMEFFPQLIDYVEKDFGIAISHRITIPF
jgi:acyl carrier protein phosphodiesterase